MRIAQSFGLLQRTVIVPAKVDRATEVPQNLIRRVMEEGEGDYE